MCCVCGGGKIAGAPSPAPSLRPTGPTPAPSAERCPASCYGRSCDYWGTYGYECSTLEDTYGCACDACACGVVEGAPTPAPTLRPSGPTNTPTAQQPTSAPTSCEHSDGDAADPYGDGCNEYDNHPSWCGGYDDADFTSSEMCCACGGGERGGPTPSPSARPTAPTVPPSVESCPASCYGQTCDFWEQRGYPCATLEDTYSCECGECACGVVEGAPTPSPTSRRPTSAPTSCEHTDGDAADPYGDGCDAYDSYPSWCGGYDDVDFTSSEMCCVCGGGERGGPTPSPSARPTGPTTAPSPEGETCADSCFGHSCGGFLRAPIASRGYRVVLQTPTPHIRHMSSLGASSGYIGAGRARRSRTRIAATARAARAVPTAARYGPRVMCARLTILKLVWKSAVSCLPCSFDVRLSELCRVIFSLEGHGQRRG